MREDLSAHPDEVTFRMFFSGSKSAMSMEDYTAISITMVRAMNAPQVARRLQERGTQSRVKYAWRSCSKSEWKSRHVKQDANRFDHKLNEKLIADFAIEVVKANVKLEQHALSLAST